MKQVDKPVSVMLTCYSCKRRWFSSTIRGAIRRVLGRIFYKFWLLNTRFIVVFYIWLIREIREFLLLHSSESDFYNIQKKNVRVNSNISIFPKKIVERILLDSSRPNLNSTNIGKKNIYKKLLSSEYSRVNIRANFRIQQYSWQH